MGVFAAVHSGRMQTVTPRQPTTPDDEARLANRLAALATRVNDAVDDATRAAAGPDLSHPEAVTALLNFANGERIEELRRALGLSQPGTAHLVSRLEERGLVARRQDPSDGRGTLVVLTPKGRRVARRIIAARQRAAAELVALLSTAEQRRMLSAVDALLYAGSAPGLPARRTCRLCDADVCGHPGECPVTLGARDQAARAERA